MTDFFDREGQPLELLDWARLYEDVEYRQVALDEAGKYSVSTVWQGFNHRLEGGNYFETAVWLTAGGVSYGEFRIISSCALEGEALAKHAQTVALFLLADAVWEKDD